MLNFNTAPYYDDFDPSKNFHRVLFKPGVAVQARELTQSQTILQNQISNFAQNIFSTNTPVTGGKVTTNLNCYYIRLNLQYNNVNITAANFLNKVIQDRATGTILAKVIATTEATGTASNPGDPPTLIVSYISGIKFSDGQTIVPSDGTNIAATVSISTPAAPSTGFSSVASISDGVFYIVNGYSQSGTENQNGTYSTYSIGNFVAVTPQTVILSKYSNTPSYRIGLGITETVIDYIDDASLLDPAIGASNYQAPGADRYQINLTLTTLPLTLGNDSEFIELVRVVNGQIVTQVEGTSYSAIDDYFAKRDYETNGDYIVNDFKLTPLANTVNTAQYDLKIGKGIAYVHGYRIENQSDLTLTSDRSRSTSYIPINDIYINYGSYFYVTNSNGFFDITTQPSIDIHSVSAANINTANANTYSSTLVGSAHIRNFVYVTDSNSASTNSYIFKAYVCDVSTNNLTSNASSGTTNSITIYDPYNHFSVTSNAYYNMIVTITSGTSSGDIRQISSYNGSTKTFTVSQPFTFTPDSTSNFTFSMTTASAESIVQKNGMYGLTANADISSTFGKVNGVVTGDTILENPGSPEMLFTIGYPYVANIAGTNYVSTKVWRNNHIFSGSGILTLNITSGPLRFIGSGTLSDSTIKQNYIVINSSTGKLLNMTSSSGATVTVSSGNQQVTFNALAYAGQQVDIITIVNVISADGSAGGILKAKNLIVGNTSIASISGPSSGGALNGTTYVDLTNGQTYVKNPGTLSNSISLYVSDVKKVTKIIDTGSPSIDATSLMLSQSQYDVTSNYQLNNGQRDNFYDHASISLIPGANPARGNLLVVYDHYSHSSGDGYFSVFSYLSAANGGISTSPEQYQNIPTYTASDGIQYKLSDTLDFRPVRQSAQTAMIYEYNIPVSSDGGILLPNDLNQFACSYSYYLARKDLLVLSKDKSFQIIEGAPAISPSFPAQPDGSLLLANLSLDAYTGYVPGENPPNVPANLSINKIPHNRWAKSDITDLQTRVNNLEYYTSLSLLEQNAQSLQVPDANGLNRFKNGILVDDFSSFATADTSNQDYAANINIRKQQLSALTVVDNFQLQNPVVVKSLGTISNTSTFAINSVNGTHTNIFTLPYTTANIVVQPLASSTVSLNPFSVGIYQGVANLFPPMDNWVDNKQPPAVLVTDSNMQISQQTNGINLTNAGDFAIIPGTEVTTSTTSAVLNNLTPGSYGGFVTTTSTYASQLQNITTTVSSSSLPSTLNINNGYVTDASIIPFIRPQQIGFTVSGLTINTPVRAYFDGQDVTKYITSPNTIELQNVFGNFNVGDIVGFYYSNSFKPIARVEGLYNYPGQLSFILNSSSGSGNYSIGETVYQGSSITSATATATVTYWSPTNYELVVNNITGNFLSSLAIVGSTYGANYKYNSNNPSNIRLYVSNVLGAPNYSTIANISTLQNALFDQNSNYIGTTASGTLNTSITQLNTSGQVTAVGGNFTANNTSGLYLYRVQDPNDWCSFLNQYGIWGDLNASSSYTIPTNSFVFAPTVTGSYTFICSSTGTGTTVTANGTTVISSASSTGTTTGSYSVSSLGYVNLYWSVTGSPGPSGFALTITDPNGNIVFNSTTPPFLTYNSVSQEVLMTDGGAWFTGVTQLMLDQNASNIANYYVGTQINITSKFVYAYTLDTATYVPPTTQNSGSGGSGYCCVVATALNRDGEWSDRQYKKLINWSMKKLDKNWIGERLHRGYHIFGPKVFIPLLKSNTFMSKYIKWSFTNATNMLTRKKFDKTSIPNSIMWIALLTLTGLFVSKKQAERSWKKLYK